MSDKPDRSFNAPRIADLQATLDLLLLEFEAARDPLEDLDSLSTGEATVFSLMAASAAEVVLPEDGMLDDLGSCRLTVRPEDDRLYLRFRAQGLAGLERWTDTDCWFVSNDGGIVLRCSFDGRGRAELVLRDTATIRDSLREARLMPRSARDNG